ncbi:hypothetical protein TYRP_008818, partial [Tyrophagus putrescentiae]
SEEMNANQVMEKLFQLHDERVHAFRLFEEGFKIYIGTAPDYNFARFRKLVCSVTKDFKRISKGIISLERELRSEGHDDLANLIERLQGEEEVRLRLCAQLQIAKQDAIDNPDCPQKWNDVALLKEKYNKSIEKVTDRFEELRSMAQTIV